MIVGEITANNVTGFNVITEKGVTSVAFRDGDMVVGVEMTSDAATDLANALRRSVTFPSEPVTARQMREMRAKEAATE